MKKKEMKEAEKIDWVSEKIIEGMGGGDFYFLAKKHIVAELKANKKKLDEEYEFYKEMEQPKKKVVKEAGDDITEIMKNNKA